MTVLRSSADRALVSFTRPLSGVGELLPELGDEGFAWLSDDAGFVTAGVAARVEVGTGPGRLARAAAEVAALLAGIAGDDPLSLPGTGPVAVGALPFEDSAPGELIIPARVLGKRADGRAWLTEIGPASDRRRAGSASRPFPTRLVATSRTAFGEWDHSVRRALGAIEEGRLSKVVLARQVAVDADVDFDHRRILERLHRRNPGSRVFGTPTFVGATPELLVSRRGPRVLSRPMAGTVARGWDLAEDERLTTELTTSAKHSDEHRAVVKAVVERLRQVCPDVVASPQPEVTRLAAMSHLTTTVTGRLSPPPPSALHVAGLLHPSPAVAGTPTEEALALIASLEPCRRGRYAGPVGWVDGRGDGDWAVALRCAELDGATARLFAGAGIVAGSDPESEWAETQLKLEPMLQALIRL